MSMNVSMRSDKLKVLVADEIDESGIDILTPLAQVDKFIKHTPEELLSVVANYDAIIVRSATRVTAELIAAAKNLKIVGRAGVGVDNIDLQAASDRGILVVCSPNGNTIAAAEHTVSLMLSLARNIPMADASVRKGLWIRQDFMGTQLQGKTLGIVGLGQVGSHVARIARALGMTILCFDPYVNQKKADSIGCKIMPLMELLRESDFVTLHVPLNSETRYLINSSSIQEMKPGARLINASRGGVVNEHDLCVAVASGRLAGAAMDVFEVEKAFPKDSELLKAPNMILTPHLGASTFEAQKNVAIDVADQIKEFFTGGMPEWIVNLPAGYDQTTKQRQQSLLCCDMLGRIAAQLLNHPVEHIKVVLLGSYCHERGNPFLMATASAVLNTHLEDRVTFINVAQRAAQEQITLEVSKGSPSDRSTISVTLMGASSTVVIEGSLLEGDKLLLHNIQNVPMFMTLPLLPSSNPVYMLYSKHDDIPGLLGSISSCLGNHRINIANCHMGRTFEGSRSLGVCVLVLDEDVNSAILSDLRSLPVIIECTKCTLNSK